MIMKKSTIYDIHESLLNNQYELVISQIKDYNNMYDFFNDYAGFLERFYKNNDRFLFLKQMINVYMSNKHNET